MSSKEGHRLQTERERRSTSSSRSFKKSASFAFSDEFAAITRRVLKEVQLTDSEMVFAGYGIVAPESNWNDYEGLDVREKTLVVLVNDPGYATQGPLRCRRMAASGDSAQNRDLALVGDVGVTKAMNSSLQSLLGASFRT